MKPPQPKPELKSPLTVAECAKRLRVSDRHVIDLIEEGKLLAINVAGANATDRKYWRVPVESLEDFMRGNASV